MKFIGHLLRPNEFVTNFIEAKILSKIRRGTPKRIYSGNYYDTKGSGFGQMRVVKTTVSLRKSTEHEGFTFHLDSFR